MLSRELKALTESGLIDRRDFGVVPPKVEYRLTDLGFSLAEAFCGVWTWAEANLERIETARRAFDTARG